MTKEDLKFRYYHGENECPFRTDDGEPASIVSENDSVAFWALEKMVSRAHPEDIIAFYEKYKDRSPLCIKTATVGEGEKAVALFCFSRADTFIDEERFKNYFAARG